jgi:two-component system LytT family sensor kinase
VRQMSNQGASKMENENRFHLDRVVGGDRHPWNFGRADRPCDFVREVQSARGPDHPVEIRILPNVLSPGRGLRNPRPTSSACLKGAGAVPLVEGDFDGEVIDVEHRKVQTRCMIGSAASHDAQATPRENRGKFRVAAKVLLIATLLGLFFAAQTYYSAASFQKPVSWGQALYWAFGDWYEWALLSPVILWLCRRFQFDRRSWPKSLPVHLVGGLLLSGVHATLCALAAVLEGWVAGTPTLFGREVHKLLANRTHFNLAVYTVIVCAWHAWDYHRRYSEREEQATELSARLAQAQLQALRMQINPHFLFNTLNSISSLMLKDVNSANRMIVRLSELLRLTLEISNDQEVPLQRELELLRRYVEIEQIRFGDLLKVKIEVEPATLHANVPNLILQPLVENAIHHAIEPQAAGGQIELRCARSNGSLVMQVSDNGQGNSSLKTNSAEVSNQARQRIGLNNTRQRLQKLYGTHQSFELVQNPTGGMTAKIIIPFQLANVVG